MNSNLYKINEVTQHKYYQNMQVITQPYEIPVSVSSPVSKAVEHTFQERNCMED